jgi:hypothetical protein
MLFCGQPVSFDYFVQINFYIHELGTIRLARMPFQPYMEPTSSSHSGEVAEHFEFVLLIASNSIKHTAS